MNVVIIGAGMCGALTGMLLADDGHAVTVLERDAATPPDDPTEAWAGWERRSVRQFHMGHFFLPRFRLELMESLPRVAEALAANGALSFNPMDGMPDSISGGWRADDDRFEALTGRRPMVEAVVARCAEETNGLTIRRGVVVTKLITARSDSTLPAPVQVVGVETDDGEAIAADLIVDAAGRNSSLPRLLRDAGAGEVVEEADDSGFVYYGRAFRSDDGSIPPSIGGGLQAYDSISTLTLAADNGTWQVAFVASGADAAMRKVRDERVFEQAWRSYPLVAHWLDGEPISDLEVMAKLEDRIRHFVVDGQPVATGIAAVGDSWACTNPSVGRGASIALVHGLELRNHLRETSMEDPVAWALEWNRRTAGSVEPYFRETVAGDRHRLGQIEAAIERRPYHSDDPTFVFTEALPVAAMKDPDVMRAWLESFMLLRTLADIMADETLVDRVLSAGYEAEPAPGLSRSELEALLA